jgi:hypothetical protein
VHGEDGNRHVDALKAAIEGVEAVEQGVDGAARHGHSISPQGLGCQCGQPRLKDEPGVHLGLQHVLDALSRWRLFRWPSAVTFSAASSRCWLRKERFDRLAAGRHGDLEWQHIVDDLDDLSEVEVEQDGRRALLRTAPGTTIDPICRALGITLPRILQEIPPAPEPRLTCGA